MTDEETRSLAVENVVSACKPQIGEVIVLEGPDHLGWCEAYRSHDLSNVRHTTFKTLSQIPVAKDGVLRIVHVTGGVPAASLSQAEDSVRCITSIADIVVFTPVPVAKQEVQDLLVAWPSFWAILFLAQGYMLRDIVRPAVWSNTYSDWDSLQGTVVFTNAAMDADWTDMGRNGPGSVVDYVHPSTHEFGLKQLLALQTAAMLTVNSGKSLSEDAAENQSLSSNIYIALPKRYTKKDYEAKLFQEQRAWWQVALTKPWQPSYWCDLWRMQRRTRRRMKSS